MNYKRIEMYRGGKNVFFEGIEGTLLDKVWRRLFRYINTGLGRRTRPVFSERVIEYPILFQFLPRDIKTVLDFGCVEDFLPMHLASLGYEVTGLDFRRYPFSHKNFNFIQGDILSWSPPKEAFDAVVSISTIEHVGLSAYGDPIEEDGDKKAVELLWQALKKGGTMIVTLPAGKKCIERGMRIYDHAGVQNLIPNIKVLKYFYKPGRFDDWEETGPEHIDGLVYENYHITSPAQGVAFIVAEK